MGHIDRGAGAVSFHSPASRRETLHSLLLLAPYLRPGDRILDLGCGPGYTAAVLAAAGWSLAGVDVVDCLRVELPEFRRVDGIELPYDEGEFDVVMLNFVLHHVSNDKKSQVIREARRVLSRILFVLEDTPKNFIDRIMSHRHGRAHQRKNGLSDSFGFYSRSEWSQLFSAHGFEIMVNQPLPRFCRGWQQPFSRSVFVLNKTSDRAALARHQPAFGGYSPSTRT